MAKDQFIQEVDASQSIAEKAWEIADGHKQKARQLLEEKFLWVKGQFISSDKPVCGFFLVGLDLEHQSIETTEGVVLNSENEDRITPSDSKKQFTRGLESLARGDTEMNASSEQLSIVLKNNWDDPGSNVRQAVESDNIGQLEALHTDMLSDEFDFNLGETTVATETEREVESKDEPSSSGSGAGDNQGEPVELPCRVEVTPVSGVPIANIRQGEEIFVNIAEVSGDKEQEFKSRLEASEDEETGMIPATLLSKEPSASGKLELGLQFAEDVYGKASCGKDVSLKVPDHTLDRYENAGGSMVEVARENWKIVSAVVGVLLITILVIWQFIF